MAIFTVDHQKCGRDGICAAVCPRGIIEIPSGPAGGFPRPTAKAEELCIDCGHCMAVCPHHALELKTAGGTDWPPFNPSLLPAPEQINELIRGRRSIRVYRNKAVERDLIEKLINLAGTAPTARNSQMLQWLVIDSKEELKALKKHVIDWMRHAVEDEGSSAVAYGFTEVLEAWEHGDDPILRNAPALIVLHAPAHYGIGLVDSAIAMTTFELAAVTMNLGTCWAGFLMIAAGAWKPLRQRLGLPDGHRITTAMMAGYPKYTYSRLPKRKAAVISWR